MWYVHCKKDVSLNMFTYNNHHNILQLIGLLSSVKADYQCCTFMSKHFVSVQKCCLRLLKSNQ